MHWTLFQQKLFSGGLGRTSEYTLCNLKICRISLSILEVYIEKQA